MIRTCGDRKMLDIIAVIILLIIPTLPVTVYIIDRLGFGHVNDGHW